MKRSGGYVLTNLELRPKEGLKNWNWRFLSSLSSIFRCINFSSFNPGIIPATLNFHSWLLGINHPTEDFSSILWSSQQCSTFILDSWESSQWGSIFLKSSNHPNMDQLQFFNQGIIPPMINVHSSIQGSSQQWSTLILDSWESPQGGSIFLQSRDHPNHHQFS